jgi:hypothetical protein
MEGWLYGVFTLVGVLAGGLFTYLGMKQQLKQQREMDSRQWRRKVRGEPLLRMRAELASMASKLERVVAAAYKLPTKSGTILEEEAKELIEAQTDWNTHVASGDLRQTLFLQSNAELVIKTKEILGDFLVTAHRVLDERKIEEAKEVLERNKTRIIEVQELINKRLEEL